MPLSPNALTVLEKRYFKRDEQGVVTEDGPAMFRRVAQTLAQPDRLYGATDTEVAETARRFYDLTYNLDFLPNSPTLANAGTRTGQLSACFVLPVPDDMAGIFDAIKLAVLIHKTGGGTGFAFSRLRPAGDLVGSTRGVSSGPTSFMDVFNAATEVVKQGGMRRGANMGILRIDHPDIQAFITHKEDLSKLTNFNISVAVTDTFMAAVEAGTTYALVNPRSGETVGELDARTVFKDIVARAWRTGEPGIVFMDRMNRYCPVPWLGGYEATNPCFAAGTMVMTSDGHFPIEELVGKTVDVWDGEDWRTIDNFRVTAENVPVYDLVLASGQRVRATAYHKFILEDGTRRELQDLAPGDRLKTHDVVLAGRESDSGTVLPGAYFLGFMVGDGSAEADGASKLYLYSGKFACAERLVASAGELAVGDVNTNALTDLAFIPCGADRKVMTGLAPRKDAIAPFMRPGRRLPAGFLNWSYAAKIEFLAGLFDADGTASDTKNGFLYQLSSVNRGLLEDVQLLLRSIGVRSKLAFNRPGGVKDFGKRGGLCHCQPVYRITVSQVASVLLSLQVKFSRLVSFADKSTAYKVRSNEGKVVGVEAAGYADKVYCCTVEGSHAFALSNGLLVGQCGEQPLIPYESCNLGSINLERFVIQDPDGPYVGQAVDWARLREVIHVSTHLLDNVIDANVYPAKEIEKVTKDTRKIGLGVMGFARMLFNLGIPYGSPKSLVLAEQLMSFIDYESKAKSVQLAKERGSFPARCPDAFTAKSNAIYREWCMERHARRHRHPDADYARLADQIEKFGIRNSTTTTIAPTGTLSIIADTSGGCEPVFALAFKRNQAGARMVDSDPVFRTWLENHGFAGTRLAELLEAIKANHGTLEGLVPDHFVATDNELTALDRAGVLFVTAHDIHPIQHVDLQAAFQAYNDSATSKTINFPESATPEDVETAYLRAWQTGCKGITVYRNGSRNDQPLSTTATPAAPAAPAEPAPTTDFNALAAVAFATSMAEQKVQKLMAPRQRPEDLYGFTRAVQTGDGKLYATINYDAEGPREVFTNVGRSGGTLAGLTEAIGRLISLALEHHVPLTRIAATLKGIRGANPFGFGPTLVLGIADAIAKVLDSAPRQLAGPVSDWSSEPAAAPAPEAVEVVVRAGGVPEAVRVFGASPECPECGSALDFGEGCQKCHGCGFSKCG